MLFRSTVTRVLTTLAVVGLILFPQARPIQAAPIATLYQVTDLGTVGGSFSVATAINNSGQVVGWSTPLGDNTYHGFLWANGVRTDLGGMPPGGTYSVAVGINNEGQVAGVSATNGGSFDTDGNRHAFLWTKGVFTDLGMLGGRSTCTVLPCSRANWINDAHQVVGRSTVPDDTAFHAFLWSRGVMTDLGSLGGNYSEALGVNDRGQIVGISLLTGDQILRATLWDGTGPHDLGSLAGPNGNSFANGVDNLGQVMGSSDTTIPDPSTTCSGAPADALPESHPVLWQNGKPADLMPFPGDPDGIAYISNNFGEVVGSSGNFCGPFRADLWHNGTVTDLNTVIPANSGWTLLEATAVNAKGQIIGYGISPSSVFGTPHAYLLTPVASGTPHSVDPHAEAARAQAAWAMLSPSEKTALKWGRPSSRTAPGGN